tara:strand:- start:561 stop:1244 length:684 start_codon:yes stop_codon:yes gene_type:complete
MNSLDNWLGIKETKPVTKQFCPNIIVYTDGACSNNGKETAKAGIGVYFRENDPRNVSKRIEGRQTNNTAELKAILEVYYILEKNIERGEQILICSDSQYAIRCCTDYGEKCEKKNWKRKKGVIPNVELVKKMYGLFKNKNNIQFKHVMSHTANQDMYSLGNEGADKLANMAIGLTSCPYSKKYLDIPYRNKEKIKKYGGKWDRSKKKWYVTEEIWKKYEKDIIILYK